MIRLLYLPSYLLAILWTFFWGNWRWLRGPIQHPKIHLGCSKPEKNLRKKFCFMWGRHESPEPIKCECGWAGPVRWLNHAYGNDGSGEDVEPVDECPRCGEEL